MFSKQCKAHLEEIEMGPIEHLLRAWKIGFTFLLLFPVMIIHGLAPRFFVTTATATKMCFLITYSNKRCVKFSVNEKFDYP